jgi:DNA mismatch repair protein MSH2
MDDNFYASLLDTSTEAPSESAALLSVLVSRRTGSTSRNLSSTSVRIVAAARIPRKRTGYDDPVKYTLQYFSFLDDKRRFTNLDSLLTRLSPVKVVHVGCNESIKLNSSSSSMNKSQQLRSQEISDLLSKVATVINTRNDILPLNANDESVSTNIIENLPNDISNASNIQLDSILSPLLGGASNPRFQAYKNDTNIMDDTLIQQGIAFLVYMENLKCQSDSDDSLGEYELAAGDLTSFLLMDRTAMECINLLPSSHDGISSLLIGGTQSNNSIFGILNKCKTKMGVRLLEMWLRQPSTDLKTILYRQSAVSKMVEDDSVGRDRLRSEGIGSLRGVDLDTLCDKMDRFSDVSSGIGATTKALECLYKLHQFADRQLPPIVAALSDMVGTEESQGIIDGDNIGALECSLHGLSLVLNELSRSVQLVETILDFDLAPREFLVKPSFNDALIELRSDLINVDDELDRLHSDMNALWSEVTNQSLGQVRLEACDSSSSSSGKDSACAWQFRLIDANSIKTLQEHPQFKGLVTVHRILKNGVYFSTKELRQLGDKKFDLLKEYDNHQREIVNNAMSVAVTYIPVLERASSIIAELDVLSSLAHVAAYSPNGYCRPEMTDGEEDGLGIQLKAARHPCVELQENVDFIPNDFQLTYGSSCFLLVTGPNMGE